MLTLFTMSLFQADAKHVTIVHDENHPDYKPLSPNELERLYGKLIETCKLSPTVNELADSAPSAFLENDDLDTLQLTETFLNDNNPDCSTEVAKLEFNIPGKAGSRDPLMLDVGLGIEQPRVGWSPSDVSFDEISPSSVLRVGTSPTATPKHDKFFSDMQSEDSWVAVSEKSTNISSRNANRKFPPEDLVESEIGKREKVTTERISTHELADASCNTDTRPSEITQNKSLQRDINTIQQLTNAQMKSTDINHEQSLPRLTLQMVGTRETSDRVEPLSNSSLSPRIATNALQQIARLVSVEKLTPSIKVDCNGLTLSQNSSAAVTGSVNKNVSFTYPTMTGRAPHRQRKQNLQVCK